MADQKQQQRTRWKLLVLFIIGLCAFAVLPSVLDGLSDDAKPARTTTTTQLTVPAAAPTRFPTTSTTPTPGRLSWAPGTFTVGSAPAGGLRASIPPGRYRAEPVTSGGFVIRCSDLPCTTNYPQNVVATEFVVTETVLELESTDAAVFLFDVRLVKID